MELGLRTDMFVIRWSLYI